MPNDEAIPQATRKFVASDKSPISGGPIIKPTKLIDDTIVIATLAGIFCNLPDSL